MTLINEYVNNCVNFLENASLYKNKIYPNYKKFMSDLNYMKKIAFYSYIVHIILLIILILILFQILRILNNIKIKIN